MAENAAPGFEARIGEVLSELSAAFAFSRTRWQRFAEEIAPGVKGVNLVLLNVISRRGPITATEIGSLVEMDKAAVSRHIAKLRELGHIDARPADGDRRVMLLTTAAPAEALLMQVREKWAGAFQERFASWDESELETLRDGLRRFNLAAEPDVPRENPAARCARERAEDPANR